MTLQFDLDLIREQIFKRRDEISDDYRLDTSYKDANSFARAVVDAMGQWVAPDPTEQDLGNPAVFEAVLKAIWSSGVRWNLVLPRIDAVRNLLHDYDAVAVTHDSEVTVAGLAAALGTRFRERQAEQILQWAIGLRRPLISIET